MSKTSYEVVVKLTTWFIIMNQIRQEATGEADVQLTENIRRYGILQPLGARHDGKLVWGHRRLRCAIAAGLEEVPTVILNKEVTEGEYLTLQMLENVQRADLSQYDMWQGCLRLLAANPGWQQQDLCSKLNLSPASISKMLSPSKLTPAWQDALQKGLVSISDCAAAARAEVGALPGLLALKLSGANREQLEAAVRKPRTAPAVKLSSIPMRLPGGTTVTVRGEEIGGEELIEALGLALDAAKKAQKESIDVKTLVKVMADKSKVGA